MSKKNSNNDKTNVELDLDSTQSLDEISAKIEAQQASEPEDKLLEENTKLKNEFLYLKAEFDNYKRNAIKERSNLVKFGNERLLVELIEVLDIFDTALANETDSENITGFVEGMNMTHHQLKSTMEKFGISCDDPAGKAFDPNLHQALSNEETDEVEPGHITQVFKKAYMLHDKMIRPAQVIVAKEKS